MVMALHAVPGCVPYARAQLRRALALRRPAAAPEALDDAALVLSELLTNAVTHGVRGAADAAERSIGLSVRLDAGRLTLTVRDPGSGLPYPAGDGDPEREDGRGLLIVAALAEAWGTTRGPGGGTRVWARLAV